MTCQVFKNRQLIFNSCHLVRDLVKVKEVVVKKVVVREVVVKDQDVCQSVLYAPITDGRAKGLLVIELLLYS